MARGISLGKPRCPPELANSGGHNNQDTWNASLKRATCRDADTQGRKRSELLQVRRKREAHAHEQARKEEQKRGEEPTRPFAQARTQAKLQSLLTGRRRARQQAYTAHTPRNRIQAHREGCGAPLGLNGKSYAKTAPPGPRQAAGSTAARRIYREAPPYVAWRYRSPRSLLPFDF